MQSPFLNWTCPTCDRTWDDERPHSHLCPDGTLYVSPSTLSSKQTCDTQVWLRAMGAGTAGENLPARAGSVFHILMADYFRERNAEQAIALLETLWRPTSDVYVDPNGPLARLMFENLDPIVRHWFDRYQINDAGELIGTANGNVICTTFPDMVEIPFQIPLNDTDDIVLIGIIDAMVTEGGTGHWLVDDHKTSGQVDKKFWSKFRMDAQVSSYVWAASQQTQRPVEGALIDAVEFRLLPQDLTRKCAIHKQVTADCRLLHCNMQTVVVPRTEGQLALWHREAVKAGRELRQLLLGYPQLEHVHKLRMQGQFTGACSDWSGCFAQAFCTGERKSAIPTAFTMGAGMKAPAAD